MLLLGPPNLLFQLSSAAIIDIRQYGTAVIRVTGELALEVVRWPAMKEVAATGFLCKTRNKSTLGKHTRISINPISPNWVKRCLSLFRIFCCCYN